MPSDVIMSFLKVLSSSPELLFLHLKHMLICDYNDKPSAERGGLFIQVFLPFFKTTLLAILQRPTMVVGQHRTIPRVIFIMDLIHFFINTTISVRAINRYPTSKPWNTQIKHFLTAYKFSTKLKFTFSLMYPYAW